MNGLIRNGHYIDGEWVSSPNLFPVHNPATGEVIVDIARGGEAEAEQAVAAAARAFPAWRALTAKERSIKVRRWGELMLQHKEALAELLTREQGKPIAEARGEVGYAASFLEWFAEEAKRLQESAATALQRLGALRPGLAGGAATALRRRGERGLGLAGGAA